MFLRVACFCLGLAFASTACADLDPPKMPPNLTAEQQRQVRAFYHSIYEQFKGRGDIEITVVLSTSTFTVEEPKLLEVLGLVGELTWDFATWPAQLSDQAFPGYIKSNPRPPTTKVHREDEFKFVSAEGKRAAADVVYLHYFEVITNPPDDRRVRVVPNWQLVGYGDRQVTRRLTAMKEQPQRFHPALLKAVDAFQ